MIEKVLIRCIKLAFWHWETFLSLAAMVRRMLKFETLILSLLKKFREQSIQSMYSWNAIFALKICIVYYLVTNWKEKWQPNRNVNMEKEVSFTEQKPCIAAHPPEPTEHIFLMWTVFDTLPRFWSTFIHFWQSIALSDSILSLKVPTEPPALAQTIFSKFGLLTFHHKALHLHWYFKSAVWGCFFVLCSDICTVWSYNILSL
jgi:hypothetical protein